MARLKIVRMIVGELFECSWPVFVYELVCSRSLSRAIHTLGSVFDYCFKEGHGQRQQEPPARPGCEAEGSREVLFQQGQGLGQ